MRVFLDQDERVIPWLQGGIHPVTNAYVYQLSQTTVLVGPNPYAEFKGVLRKLTTTPGVELIRAYLGDNKLLFIDSNNNQSAIETPELPRGLFPDLLDSVKTWESILSDTQGALLPNEGRGEAFDRLLGKLVTVGQAIEIIDPYLTCPLLFNAISDSSVSLFWLDKLLSSSATKVIITSLHPSNKLMGMSDKCRDNERLKQISDEDQRLRVILGYLASEKKKYGFTGSIEFRSTSQMPHDRYLRFGLINGSAFIGLPKGIDPFEKDPLESVHKFTNLDKYDWKKVMDSPEWGERDRTTLEQWAEFERQNFEDGGSVSIFKSRWFRSPFTSSKPRVR